MAPLTDSTGKDGDQNSNDLSISEISEKVVHLRDHSTKVIDSHGGQKGGGVPIVLLHALSMDCHMWKDGLFLRLAKSGDDGTQRRIIAYDLRGHGQAVTAPLTQSLDQLAEDLFELVRALNLEKIDLYGVSYGGGVAQKFTLAYPDIVRSLAIIASGSKGNEIIRSRATLAEANGVEYLEHDTIARWFLPETIRAPSDSDKAWMVAYARAGIKEARVENWAAAWRAMADLDCENRLYEIKVPVLVLAGTQDTSTPPALMKRTFERCNHGEYREVSRGMHLFVMENHEAAATELLAFRSRVDIQRVWNTGICL